MRALCLLLLYFSKSTALGMDRMPTRLTSFPRTSLRKLSYRVYENIPILRLYKAPDSSNLLFVCFTRNVCQVYARYSSWFTTYKHAARKESTRELVFLTASIHYDIPLITYNCECKFRWAVTITFVFVTWEYQHVWFGVVSCRVSHETVLINWIDFVRCAPGLLELWLESLDRYDTLHPLTGLTTLNQKSLSLKLESIWYTYLNVLIDEGENVMAL